MYIVNEWERAYRFGDSGPKYLMKGPRMNFALVQFQAGQDFKAHYHNVMEENFYILEGEVDIVVDCVDNIETRLLIEEECEKRKKVLIHGAVDGIMGQCMICYPGERRLSKMYRKSKDVPHKTYSFVVALVASIQVALVYSVLKHEDEDTKGKLFMLDLGVMETRVVKL